RLSARPGPTRRAPRTPHAAKSGCVVQCNATKPPYSIAAPRTPYQGENGSALIGSRGAARREGGGGAAAVRAWAGGEGAAIQAATRSGRPQAGRSTAPIPVVPPSLSLPSYKAHTRQVARPVHGRGGRPPDRLRQQTGASRRLSLSENTITRVAGG